MSSFAHHPAAAQRPRIRRAVLAAVLAILAGGFAAPQASAAASSVSAGFERSCAVGDGGAPLCWGYRWDGRLDVPADLGPVSSIAAGGSISIAQGQIHSCAVKVDGTPRCWGTDGFGQVSGAAGQGPVSSISAGGRHTCAIRTNGTPVCWGDNGKGQSSVPLGIGTVSAISAGDEHTCAIPGDQTPVCWGSDSWSNSYGEYGSERVSGAAGVGPVTAISAGRATTCAVKANGDPVCWGKFNDRTFGTPPAGPMASISVGGTHQCAVRTNGTPLCWGGDEYGQSTIPAGLGAVSSISAGWTHTCAVKVDGAVACWGYPPGATTVPLPAITSLPTVAAADGWTVGKTATAQPGSWSHGPTAYTYSWRRCTSTAEESCEAISGSADADDGDASYTLTPAEQSTRLRVTVVAENPLGSGAPASSGASSIVGVPEHLAPPTMSASGWAAGGVVTADPGDWTNEPTGHTFVWQRCTGATPASCEDITGSDDANEGNDTYTLTGEDTGNRLRVVVTASNGLGTGEPAASSLGPRVGIPAATRAPSITGSARVGSTLTLDRGDWTNSPTSYAMEWVRCATTAEASCVALTSADATDGNLTYQLVEADYARDIRARVTATATAGTSEPAFSAATAVAGLRPGTGQGLISAGEYHTCAVRTDGTPGCWGRSGNGWTTVPPGTGTVSSLSAGAYYTCAVKTDGGTPVCWGVEDYGRISGATGKGPIKSVAATYEHTCAVQADDTPVCWGRNQYQQTSVPGTVGTVAAVAVGTTESCAIKAGDRSIACWGTNNFWQFSSATGQGPVAALSIGTRHACAVRMDGTPACWGYDGFGEATVPGDIGKVVAIDVGDFHTCAIKLDGAPVCWGRDSSGQSSVPASVGPVSAITAGYTHSCAVKRDGAVACWGDSPAGSGPAGTVGPLRPAMTERPAATADEWTAGMTATAQRGEWSASPDDFRYEWLRCPGASEDGCQVIPGTRDQADGGASYTLTTADEGKRIRVRVTAANAEGSGAPATSLPSPVVGLPVVRTAPTISGQSAPGSTLTVDPGAWSNTPTGYDIQWLRCADPTPASCQTVAGASGSTYPLTNADDGSYMRANVAASNSHGAGERSLSGATGLIEGPPAPASGLAVEAGANHTCAVKAAGTVVCWGGNGGGQTDVPMDAGQVISLSAARDHTCAVRTNHTPVCWGQDSHGSVYGAAGQTRLASISAGADHTCAVRVNGTPVCWGYDGDGRAASGAAGKGPVKAISAGRYNTCAIRANDTPVCWGDNSYGESSPPADIGTVSAISVGDVHACAIKTSGTPVCWGRDSFEWYEEADGRVTGTEGRGPVSGISAGGAQTCAVALDGTPVCWGSTLTGATAVPAGIGKLVSISAGDAHACGMTRTGQPVCWGYNSDGQARPPVPVSDPAARPELLATAWAAGSQIRTTNGTWSPEPTNYAYRWLRCTSTAAADCAPITGTADADDGDSTYTPVAADNGKRLRSEVTARTADFTGAPATSAPSPVIGLPARNAAPVVSGRTRTGDTLTTTRGDWSQSPTRYAIEWLRCSSEELDGCVKITSTDATDGNTTYKLVDADDAYRIRSRVTASNAAGAGEPASSAATAVIDIPTLITAPSISGTLKTGDTLTANPGQWTGDPTSHDVEWLRCTSLLVNSCSVIADATGLTYTLVDADDAKRMRVRVAGRNDGGAGVPSTSTYTGIVDLPTNRKPPSISGTTKTGDTLTADVGEWTGAPTGYTIEWLRCTDTTTTSCLKITSADATDNTSGYTLVDADDARRIRTRVTARNAGGASPAVTSIATAVVDLPTLLTAPAVTGTTRTGDTLTTTQGKWTGAPTSYVVEWLRCTGTTVSSCTAISTADATDNTATYKLVDLDDAKRIRSRVTARNAGGAGTPSASEATAVVDLPTVLTAPTVSGTTRTGDTLTANPGTWTGEPTGYVIEWLRCSSTAVADCLKITATDATNGDASYTLTNYDDAKRIRVRVAGRNAGGTGAASTSAATAVVDIPTLLTAPSVSGTTRTGDTLTVNTGGWTGNPTAYAIEWLRCTTIYLAHCTPITGADATDQNRTYLLVDADDGARIRARVTPRNASGTGPASTSLYTGIVDLPTASKAPSVSGSTKTGDTLTVDRGEWTGAPTGYTIEWLRCTTTAVADCVKMTSTDATNGDLIYKLVDLDDAKRIRARVTGKNANGTGTPATTAATAVVDLPTLINAPVVTGTAQVGQLLTTTRGDWTGSPTGHTIEWLRCTSLYLSNCTAITTADATDGNLTYTPAAGDQGARIRSRVTARNAGGEGPKTPSLYTKVVVAP